MRERGGRAGALTKRVDMTNHVDILGAPMNRNYLRAIPREWRNISRLFAALGDEHRQRILLTFEPGERLNVGSIVAVSTL